MAILTKLPLFPLPGAILLPDMHLPLHIFEPRYRAMVGEGMVRGQRIGMIQPIAADQANGHPPALFSVGTIGRMIDIEAMEDGRYNIVLEGEQRFTLVHELAVSTPFRQADVECWDEAAQYDEALPSVTRAALEQSAQQYAAQTGYEVDWRAVEQLDDHSVVNGMAMLIPFDPSAKQALLEARGLSDRASILMDMLHFMGRHDGGGEAGLMN